jgi:hypothetical protein
VSLLSCLYPASSPTRCPASPAGCPYSVVSLQPFLLAVLILLAGCHPYSVVSLQPLLLAVLLLRLGVLTQLSLSSLSCSLSCFCGWVSLLSCLSPASFARCPASPAGCPFFFSWVSLLLRLGVLDSRLRPFASPAGCPFFSGWESFLLRLGFLASPAWCPCFSGLVSLLLRLSVLASPAECP